MSDSSARRSAGGDAEGSPTTAGERTEPGEGVETAGERPPGPDGYPVVGSLPAFVRSPLSFLDEVAGYGDVARYRVLNDEIIALFHPDHIERVLVTDHDRFVKGDLEREIISEFAGESVVITEGDQWRRQRTAMQPAFTLDRIRTYAETMAEYSAQASEEWATADAVRVDDRAADLALRILAKSVFDVDVEAADGVVTAAAESLNRRMDPTTASSLVPSWVPTPTNRRFRRSMAAFDDLVDDLIARREADPEDHDDLLSMLLAARDDGDGEGLTDAEIRDQVKTFLFAGHETTATAIAFACFLLGTNPEKQRKLREEVDEVTGGDPPTLAEVMELEYADRVVTETLRRYPPVTGVFREPLEDLTIGGYRIPEGSTVLCQAYQVHNDERWYDDPDAFRPERWTDDLEDDLPDYAYFPFGGGPRHCIGMRFARMELKIVLATLAGQTNFESLTREVDPTFEVTLTTEEPIRVAFEKR